MKNAGSFINWMKDIQAAYKKSGLNLDKDKLDEIVAEARRYGLDVRLDPPHSDTLWEVPHLNIKGHTANVHIPVPPDYELPK